MFLQMLGTPLSCSIRQIPDELPQYAVQILSMERFTTPSLPWFLISGITNKTIHVFWQVCFYAHQNIPSYMCIGTVSRNSSYLEPSSMFPFIFMSSVTLWSLKLTSGYLKPQHKAHYSCQSLLKITDSLNTMSSARLPVNPHSSCILTKVLKYTGYFDLQKEVMLGLDPVLSTQHSQVLMTFTEISVY